jgi:hypothetical protein
MSIGDTRMGHRAGPPGAAAASAAPPPQTLMTLSAISSGYPTTEAFLERSAVQAHAPAPMSKKHSIAFPRLFGGTKSRKREVGADAAEADESDEDAGMGNVRYPTRISESARKPETAALLATTNEEKMLELVSLQTFDGSWKWTAKLFSLLGVEEEMLKTVLDGLEETVMATLLAVAFLESKIPEEEGVWEMIVEKAKGWLDGKTSVVDGLAKVKKQVF